MKKLLCLLFIAVGLSSQAQTTSFVNLSSNRFLIYDCADNVLMAVPSGGRVQVVNTPQVWSYLTALAPLAGSPITSGSPACEYQVAIFDTGTNGQGCVAEVVSQGATDINMAAPFVVFTCGVILAYVFARSVFK